MGFLAKPYFAYIIRCVAEMRSQPYPRTMPKTETKTMPWEQRLLQLSWAILTMRLSGLDGSTSLSEAFVMTCESHVVARKNSPFCIPSSSHALALLRPKPKHLYTKHFSALPREAIPTSSPSHTSLPQQWAPNRAHPPPSRTRR